MKEIGIDLGASNIKIAGKVSNGIKLEMVKSLVQTYGTDGKNTVTYKNKKYHFGIGDSLIVRDKTKRKFMEESILLSYYKIYGKTSKTQEVTVGIGIPINLFLAEAKRKNFEVEIEKLQDKVISGEVNNEKVSIKIVSVKIYSEGFSAAKSLAEDLSDDNNAIIADIGYKTVDVIAMALIDNEWEITSNFTIDKGMWDVFVEIKKSLLSMDIDMSEETIQQRLINTPKFNIHGKAIDLRDMLKYGVSIVEYIFNQIELRIDDFATSNIYLAGGGSIFVNSILEESISNVILIEDTDKLLFANAIGYLILLDEELKVEV